ncbi:MAG: hypothetical protein BWY79_01938 [Actinobacteria bacterium ADurb.Bin444]|nr:MAG: hypothetical protein BWY79_01938 [Actinobacteria bacterium ADurb.Bin444]
MLATLPLIVALVGPMPVADPVATAGALFCGMTGSGSGGGGGGGGGITSANSATNVRAEAPISKV